MVSSGIDPFRVAAGFALGPLNSGRCIAFVGPPVFLTKHETRLAALIAIAANVAIPQRGRLGRAIIFVWPRTSAASFDRDFNGASPEST